MPGASTVEDEEVGQRDEIPLPNPESVDGQSVVTSFATFSAQRSSQTDLIDRFNAPGKIERVASDTTLVDTNDADEKCPLEEAGAITRHVLWQPFWLKRTTLLAFACLFTCIAIALSVLWWYSLKFEGIKLTLSKNEYAWTYGPTAILVVVVSLWRQVDFYCKLLSPWQNLQQGPAPAAHTILLDYISPFQLQSFWKSCRHKNWSVAISIAGFALLKLIVVFSTGLLVATSLSFTESATSITLVTKFDALPYNASLDASQQTLRPDEQDSQADGNYLAAPLYTYYGILKDGMAEPAGSSNGVITQSFELSNTLTYATNASAIVDMFVPTTSCEIAIARTTNYTTNDFPSDNEGGAVFLTIDTDDGCHLGYGNNITDSQNMFMTTMKNPRTQLCPPREFMGSMSYRNCSTPTRPPNSTSIFDGTDGDYRWVLTVSDISYNQTIGTGSNSSWINATSWSRRINGVTAIVCNVTYTMANGSLDYNFAGGTEQINAAPFDLDSQQQLPGLSNTQLNSAIITALTAGANLFPSQDASEGVPSSFVDSVFALMEQVYGTDSNQPFTDGGVMVSTAETVFQGISRYWAQANLLNNETLSSTGELIYSEDRLQIRPASMWFMFSAFFILAVLSLSLVFVRPYKVVSIDPTTLAAGAALLNASSAQFKETISSLGSSQPHAMRKVLRPNLFQTSATGSFKLDTISEASLRDQKQKDDEKASKPYYPLAVTYPILAIMLSLPILAIIVLEVLHQVSNHNNGLATLTSKTIEYSYYYVTSSIVLLIATLFNSFDFQVAAFSPFNALRSKSTPAKHSILSHLIGEIAPVAFVKSVFSGHYGASLSTLAGLIGSTLTILVSGLWIMDSNTIISHSVSLQRLDGWNTTWPDSVTNDSGAATIYSMIQNQHLTYPRWTYDELVFPKVGASFAQSQTLGGLGDGFPGQPSAAVLYDLALPALRANLNCSIIPAQNILISQSVVNLSHPGSFEVNEDVVAQAALPPGCYAGLSHNETYINLTAFYSDPYGRPSPGGYVGVMLDLALANSTAQDISTENEYVSNPAGCPSLGFVFGYLQVNSTPPENVTAMICSQEIQELTTTLTLKQDVLNGNSSAVMINGQPYADESTIKLLTNGTKGVTSFPWWPVNDMQQQIQKANITGDGDSGIVGDAAMEVIFQIVFNSTGTWDPQSYMGPENAERLMQDLNQVYRQYMAQVINLNMRIDLESDSSPMAPWNHDINDDTARTFTASRQLVVTRLKVNGQSKLILQIFLAVMFVCGFASFCLVRIRGTLPHGPCSIAGTMSLLVDSDFCEKIPEGSEWLKEKELYKVISQQGWLYSLGWWKTSQGQERFGIDIGKAEWK